MEKRKSRKNRPSLWKGLKFQGVFTMFIFSFVVLFAVYILGTYVIRSREFEGFWSREEIEEADANGGDAGVSSGGVNGGDGSVSGEGVSGGDAGVRSGGVNGGGVGVSSGGASGGGVVVNNQGVSGEIVNNVAKKSKSYWKKLKHINFRAMGVRAENSIANLLNDIRKLSSPIKRK